MSSDVKAYSTNPNNPDYNENQSQQHLDDAKRQQVDDNPSSLNPKMQLGANAGISDIAIRVSNLSKCYNIFDAPRDRLKQFIVPRLRKIAGVPPKKYFREFWALRNVSFDIRRGETVGIIGRNGSGKSTLLQIICGTLSPSSGLVETNGRVAALLELGAGFNPDFSGRENVYLAGQILGLSWKEVDEKFSAIEEFAEIGNFIDQPLKTYSSGMYVRLAFSVAAHVEPEILVVDEALAVGDFLFQQKCSKFMQEKLANTTKLLVTHDLSAITSLTSRAIVLNQGNLRFDGDPATAIEQYQIIARAGYGGKNINSGVDRIEDTKNIEPTIIDDVNVIKIPLNKLSGLLAVKIDSVAVSIDGNWDTSYIKDGKVVQVRLYITADKELPYPIIGYQIQDRFGNVIFGENSTSLPHPPNLLEVGKHVLELQWEWPLISPGKYGLTLGIGNGGDALMHDIECWAHNVIILDSSASTSVHGIFNVPLISLEYKGRSTHGSR